MIGGVFVRALNENRTRGLPLRRRTLYPLSYKGDGIVFAAWVTPEPPYMAGTTNIESSVEGKSIRRAAAKLLLLDSNQDQRFQRPVCCRLHQGGMCANASDTYARLRSAMPIQPVLLTGFQALSRGLTHC